MVLYPNKLPESERVCSGICIVQFRLIFLLRFQIQPVGLPFQCKLDTVKFTLILSVYLLQFKEDFFHLLLAYRSCMGVN